MNEAELDEWISMVKTCKYLPEHHLKVRFGYCVTILLLLEAGPISTTCLFANTCLSALY